MTPEARNPFYLLLLVVSVAFTMTALAYAFPLDMLPEWFQAHGWQLLLVELGLVILFGLASMGLDRFRQSGARSQGSGVTSQETEVRGQEAESAGVELHDDQQTGGD